MEGGILMKQTKIVHIANFDLGLKIHLGNYMRYQRDQGYCVSAITHPGRWLTQDTTILDGIPVKIMSFRPRISPLADLKTMIRLIYYFRRERFDIVHTHTVKPGLLGRIAAKIVGVPVIAHTVHGFYFDERMSPIQYRLHVLIEKLGSACCDLILSQSKQDIETGIQERISPPEKIRYIGNGIDLSRFDPSSISSKKVKALRDDLGIPPHQIVIGFIGRWEVEKGICEFLEAASHLKSKGVKAKYLIIGAPQAQKRTALSFQGMLLKYGLEEETMLLDFRDDIPELLTLMNIVVMPSHRREGLPRILMESAALGKPVVATRRPGNVEAVEDGVTGLLVPMRDGLALAEGILRLVGNPEYAAEMGRQARQRALNHFDERFFFWKTDIEYRRLLETKLGLDTSLALSPVPSTLMGL
jgi:glycosyltransferase involved in cell wall biosynthesis